MAYSLPLLGVDTIGLEVSDFSLLLQEEFARVPFPNGVLSSLFVRILLLSVSFSLGNLSSCSVVFGVKTELVVLTTSLSSIADMEEEGVMVGLQFSSFTGGPLVPYIKMNA